MHIPGFDTLGRTLRAARHIPPRAIALRLRRGWRTRRVCRRFAAVAVAPDDVPVSAIVARLQQPGMIAAARRQAEVLASVYGYERATSSLRFRKSGDVIDVTAMIAILWRQPNAVAASDVNRAFFVAFVEHAPLAVIDSPAAGLHHLAELADVFRTEASPTSSVLPLPWQPLPAARRLINMLSALSSALADQPDLAASPAIATILADVLTCGRIVDVLREDDLGYNHLATAMFAQTLLAAAMGAIDQQGRHARAFLDTLEAQTGADGLQRERSATYQAHLLGHLDVLLAGGLLPTHITSRATALASRMRAALAVLTHPDGDFAIFNDCAAGDGPSPASLGVSLHHDEGITRLAEAGYVRLQDSRVTAIFDVGRCAPDETPGHAHADFLSVEVSLFGRRFIVDPGVASYKPGIERQWTRSSHSHNGPGWDEVEPIEFFGAFRVGRRGRAFEITSATPDGVAGTQTGFDRIGARVGRQIALAQGDGLVIVDVWTGGAALTPSSLVLVDAAWTLVESGAAQVRFRGPLSEDVVLTVLGGRFEVSHGRHFAFGPRSPQAATAVRAAPDARYLGLSVRLGKGAPLIDAQRLNGVADQLRKTLLAARAPSD